MGLPLATVESLIFHAAAYQCCGVRSVRLWGTGLDEEFLTALTPASVTIKAMILGCDTQAVAADRMWPSAVMLSRRPRLMPGVSQRTRDHHSWYSMRMDSKQLLAEALQLSPEQRAALAGELIRSLDSQIDEDAEAAWSAEIRRRLEWLDPGSTQTVSWSEARRRIRAAARR